MNPLGVAAWAWRAALRLTSRPMIWGPLFVVAGAKLAVLSVMVFFHWSMLLPIGYPLVKLLGGEAATHYPVLFYALPTMFARANLAVGVLVASIAGGAATLAFARGYGFFQGGGVWGRAWRSAPTLIMVNLVAMALLLGATFLTALVPKTAILESASIRWGTRAASLLLFIAVESFVVYTTAWVVLYGHGPWSAYRDSVRVTLRTFVPTAIVVAVPAMLLYPLTYAGSRVDVIVGKFRPELVFGLLCTEILVEFLATFVLIGAVTRLFLWRTESTR